MAGVVDSIEFKDCECYSEVHLAICVDGCVCTACLLLVTCIRGGGIGDRDINDRLLPKSSALCVARPCSSIWLIPYYYYATLLQHAVKIK